MTTQVFVYGTLRGGGRNWRHLLAPLEGRDGMSDPCFTMRNHGHFPSAHRGGVTSLRGEVMAVTAQQLASIDQLEGHPDWYCREEVRVTLQNGQRVQAWMYLMPSDTHLDAEIIASGDWASHQQAGE